jgi:hypothetical protein
MADTWIIEACEYHKLYKPNEKAPDNSLRKGEIHARRYSREASAKRRPHCKACSGKIEREMTRGVTLESIHERIDELEPGGEEHRTAPINGAGSSADQLLASSSLPANMALPINIAGSSAEHPLGFSSLPMAWAMPINSAGASADEALGLSSLPVMAMPIDSAGASADHSLDKTAVQPSTEQPTVSQPAASQPASSQESSHESCRAQLAELTAQLTATKLAFDQSEANGKLIAEEKVALQEQLDHANSTIEKLMDFNDELEQQLAALEALRANAPPAAALDPLEKAAAEKAAAEKAAAKKEAAEAEAAEAAAAKAPAAKAPAAKKAAAEKAAAEKAAAEKAAAEKAVAGKAAAAALDPPAASTTPPLASASLGGGLALLAFPIGSRVYVKRSSKQETIAFVKEYDAGNNVYKLQLTGDDSGNTKQCLEKHMRAAPVEDGHAAATAALGPPQKQPAAGGLAAGSSSGADASDELTAAEPPAPKPPAAATSAASDEPPAAKPPTAKPPAAKRPMPNPAQAAAPPKSPRLAASAHPVKCYFHGLELTTGEFHCHRPQTAATMRLCAAPNCMQSQSKCSAASFHYQCYFDYYTEKMIDLSSDWNPFRCPACDDPVQ